MQNTEIGFIGAGNMASSLIGGVIASGCPANLLWIADPVEATCNRLRDRYGVNVARDNAEVIERANVVILAVKPQSMRSVCADIAASVLQRQPLIISVAAGIRSQSLFAWMNSRPPLVRCMPNTPAAIGAGATALFGSETATEDHRNIAESLMRGVGIAVWVQQESELDTVTALSGSGPAYFFLVIQALQEAGEKLGLSAEAARLLTLQTALGAAKMALESEVDVRELRRRVTSPGGTTEEAMRILLENHVTDLFERAVAAANDRATQLADQFGEQH